MPSCTLTGEEVICTGVVFSSTSCSLLPLTNPPTLPLSAPTPPRNAALHLLGPSHAHSGPCCSLLPPLLLLVVSLLSAQLLLVLLLSVLVLVFVLLLLVLVVVVVLEALWS